jgi:hypothetical protein
MPDSLSVCFIHIAAQIGDNQLVSNTSYFKKAKKQTVKIRSVIRNFTQLHQVDFLRIFTKSLYSTESQAI